jgi:hypothetical protein
MEKSFKVTFHNKLLEPFTLENRFTLNEIDTFIKEARVTGVYCVMLTEGGCVLPYNDTVITYEK